MAFFFSFFFPAAALPHSKPNYSDVMSCASGAGFPPENVEHVGNMPAKCARPNEFKHIKNIHGVSRCTLSSTCVPASSTSAFHEGKDTN